MAENYIVINGKRAELTKEQLKQLGINVPKKPSPFDRVREHKCFYYIDSNGNVMVTIESYSEFDNSCYKYGNYCTDEYLMEQRALHEALSRLLWRYSMEHEGSEIKDGVNSWYIICKNRNGITAQFSNVNCLEPKFKTAEIAENAIKEIVKPFMAAHPEFKW